MLLMLRRDGPACGAPRSPLEEWNVHAVAPYRPHIFNDNCIQPYMEDKLNICLRSTAEPARAQPSIYNQSMICTIR